MSSSQKPDNAVSFGVFVRDEERGLVTCITVPRNVLERVGLPGALHDSLRIAMEANARSIASYMDIVHEAFGVDEDEL